MIRNFTLEYWQDQSWYAGRLREVPGVFSQGRTIQELEEHIRDAYELVRSDERDTSILNVQTKEIGVEV